MTLSLSILLSGFGTLTLTVLGDERSLYHGFLIRLMIAALLSEVFDFLAGILREYVYNVQKNEHSVRFLLTDAIKASRKGLCLKTDSYILSFQHY